MGVSCAGGVRLAPAWHQDASRVIHRTGMTFLGSSHQSIRLDFLVGQCLHRLSSLPNKTFPLSLTGRVYFLLVLYHVNCDDQFHESLLISDTPFRPMLTTSPAS